MPVEALRRTPLFERHEALGARLVGFAGWAMPVQYTSIVEEHRAVRTTAGAFDVSHMGQLELSGEGWLPYLQSRLSNDIDRLAAGEAQYTLLTNDRGGVEDDLLLYRNEDGALLVVNAANTSADHLLVSRARDVSADWAMIAVQGPEALPRLEVEIAPFAFRRQEVLGIDCVLCGTGYTGERGCELLCAPSSAPALWDRVLERGVVPCGLGARDTLRLEACYPLHGQDLGPTRSPLEAGLAFACALGKDFPGVDVLRREHEAGPAVRLSAFVMEETAIPRAGMAVEEGGEVTSGGFSPMLERGVGLAYLPAEAARPGTPITIDVRGRPRRARVVRKPIYPPKER